MASGYTPQEAELDYNRAVTWVKRDAHVLPDSRTASGFVSLPDGGEITQAEAFSRITAAGGSPENILARIPGTAQYKELPETSTQDTAQAATEAKPVDTPPESEQAKADEEPVSQEEAKRIEDSENSDDTSNSDEPEPDSQPASESGENGVPSAADTTERTDTVPDKVVVANSAATSGKTVIQVRPNVLHQYASYTYGLTWHMLSKEDYNQMAQDPDSGGKWRPSHTIIASAGKRGGSGSGFERQKEFLEDFYVDNFKMQTIVGMNEGNRNSNAISFSFTIIEPYGMTLIDRLMRAADDIEAYNYLEVPYLLQIDFYGYDDEGNQSNIIDHRKYIPMKLIECKIKISNRGAEYAIQGAPFAHGGFTETIGTTPANFEVTGKTLADFFKSDTDESAAIKQLKEREVAANTAATSANSTSNTDVRKSELNQTADSKAAAVSGQGEGNAYSVKSYVGAYNAWSSRLGPSKDKSDNKINAQADYNEIAVTFDPKIISANNGKGGEIVQPEVQSAKQTAEDNPNDPNVKRDQVRANAGKPVAQVKFTVGKWAVSGGMQITEVINMMMKSSNYIRSQMIDTEKGVEQNVEDKKKPVNWWKIVPSIQLKKFDPNIGKWTYKITYHVVAYTVYNTVHPDAPLSFPDGYHKDYQYIYTGHNSDIIDFQIQLDAMFYTAVTINRGKNQAVTGPVTGTDESSPSDQTETSNVGYVPQKKSNQVNPPRITPVEGNQNNTVGGNQNKDSIAGSVASVAQSIYANAKADMLSVQLKIIGDPMFIKQDDMYYTPANARFQTQDYGDTYIGDGQNNIGMDGGEVHVRLTFRTPIDIDDDTGLVKFDGPSIKSVFSGIYRILTVDNTFAQGKFEQTLEMIRLQNQPIDEQPALADQRKDFAANTNASILSAITNKAAALDSTVTDAEKQSLSSTADVESSSTDAGTADENGEPPDNTNIDTSDDQDDEQDENTDDYANIVDDDTIEDQDIDSATDEANNTGSETPVQDPFEDPGAESAAVVAAMTDEERNAALIADLEKTNPEALAKINELTAQMNSSDPREQLKASEAMLEQSKSLLVALDLNQQFLDAFKKAQADPEFQAKATDKEKADVAQGITDLEEQLVKTNEARTTALAEFAKSKALLEEYKASPEYAAKIEAYKTGTPTT